MLSRRICQSPSLHLRLHARRAVTLTELAVSFGIGSTLVLLLVLGLSSFQKTQKNEQARMALINTIANLKASFQADIEVAVLNNSSTSFLNIVGDTNNRLYGMGTNIDSPGEFSFQVFKPFNESLSLPVSFANGTNSINVTTPTTGTSSNEATYMQTALASGRYFLISNALIQALVERANSSTNVLNPNPNLTTFGLQFAGQSNFIRTAEKITFDWNETSGTLQRTSAFRSGGQATQEVFLTNVRNFRIGYTFRKRQDLGFQDSAIIPPIPATPNALNLPNTFEEAWTLSNCAPSGDYILTTGWINLSCVRPANINRVYVHLEFKTDLTKDQLQNLETSIEGVKIQFNTSNQTVLVDFELTARDFSDRAAAALATGQNVTCQPTTTNHCRAQCAEVFTSTDPNSPSWIGYGRYKGHPNGASDYCLCWTDLQSGQLESPIGNWNLLPAWTASGNNTPANNQVEACGRHYGCNFAFLNQITTIHPGYKLACDCLQGPTDDHFVNRSISNRPRFDSLSGPQLGGYTLKDSLTQYQGNSSSSNPFLDPKDRHINCSQFGNCAGSMNRFYNVPTGSNLAQTTLTQRCGCLTSNIPYACDTRNLSEAANDPSCKAATGTTINFASLDFSMLCNRDYRNNTTTPLACPNTWAPANFSSSVTVPTFDLPLDVFNANASDPNNTQARYHIQTTSNNIPLASRFGISRTIAETCECLETSISGRYQSSNNGLFASNLNAEGEVLDNFASYPATIGQGVNELDFRIPIDPGNLPGGNPPAPTAVTSNGVTVSIAQYPVLGSNISRSSPDYYAITPNTSGGWNLAQQWSPSTTCGANHCTLNGNAGPGCCTQQQTATVASITSPDLQPWSGYCRANSAPVCATVGNFTNVQAPFLEIGLIRRWITQTPAPNQLPADCGGAPSGGGSPQF